MLIVYTSISVGAIRFYSSEHYNSIRHNDHDDQLAVSTEYEKVWAWKLAEVTIWNEFYEDDGV